MYLNKKTVFLSDIKKLTKKMIEISEEISYNDFHILHYQDNVCDSVWQSTAFKLEKKYNKNKKKLKKKMKKWIKQNE